MAFVVLTLLIPLIVLVVGGVLAGTTAESGGEAVGIFAVVGGIGFVAYIVLSVLMSIHQVDAGHVGVVYSFGEITGQTGEGIVWTAPWKEVKKANVQIQSHKFENLSAASKETQDVYLTVTLNYSISPDAIQTLYRTVGPGYFDKLVESRVNQFFKDETVAYEAIVITQKRDELRESVKARLAKDLEPYSISVIDLLIDNISYSDAFNTSIEEKQVATQNALRAQEQVKQKQFEAEQAVAVAKGEADATITRARGQSEANNLINASLTPNVLQSLAIEKLSDNIQIALVPSGQGLILDPATILKGK